MRKFCIEIVKATVESREQRGVVRQDLMQSMIQLRNNNDIEHSDEFKLDAEGMNIKLHSLLVLSSHDE